MSNLLVCGRRLLGLYVEALFTKGGWHGQEEIKES
jgi:hypothetical protein